MEIDFNDSLDNWALSCSSLRGSNLLNMAPFSVVTSIEACVYLMASPCLAKVSLLVLKFDLEEDHLYIVEGKWLCYIKSKALEEIDKKSQNLLLDVYDIIVANNVVIGPEKNDDGNDGG